MILVNQCCVCGRAIGLNYSNISGLPHTTPRDTCSTTCRALKRHRDTPKKTPK